MTEPAAAPPPPTALVTGATSGLGYRFAQRLAARGYDLVLVARDVDRLESAAAELGHAYGGAVEVLAADLGVADQLSPVEDRLADRSRPVDLLVNNAGYGVNRRFTDSRVDAEEQQLDVLVRAVLRLTHAALPGMLARGRGAVVNVSSAGGYVAGGTYNAAKGWVLQFSVGLAAELDGTGVRVMALVPGFVRTEFHARGGMDVSRIPGWMWLNTGQVVDGALADLARGRSRSVPTARYKAMIGAARHLPPGLVAAVYRKGRPKA
jgi:short-subunit dehydrogenase